MASHEPVPPSRENREIFRRNLCIVMERKGFTPKDLVAQAGFERHVVARWMRKGIHRPRMEHLTRLAKFLGLADPWALFDPDLSDTIDQPRSTWEPSDNPLVEEVRQARPDLFRSFRESDWIELYSMRGTGGALTDEGVVAAAQHINEKRSLRKKFEAVVETHHFSTLRSIIELMYEESGVSGLKRARGTEARGHQERSEPPPTE